jgi:hypothetical protein
MEHQLSLTALLNRLVPGPVNALFDLLRIPHEAGHPWTNWLAMEVLVAAIIVVVFALCLSTIQASCSTFSN